MGAVRRHRSIEHITRCCTDGRSGAFFATHKRRPDADDRNSGADEERCMKTGDKVVLERQRILRRKGSWPVTTTQRLQLCARERSAEARENSAGKRDTGALPNDTPGRQETRRDAL